MAQATGLTWRHLSDDLREVVTWAAACQPEPEVGTEGLLVGLLRASRSPVDALLEHFGVEREDLFAALERHTPTGYVLVPAARAPVILEDLPPLTRNAIRVLGRTLTLRGDVGLAALDTARLFGALLDIPETVAHRALVEIINDVPLNRVRDATFEWLRGNGRTYEETLQRDCSRRPGVTARTAPDSPVATEAVAAEPPGPGANEPWPHLCVVMQRHTTNDGGPDSWASGLGFLLDGDGNSVITTTPRDHVSFVLLPLTDTTHECYILASSEELTWLTLSQSPPLNITDIVPTMVSADPGKACFFATVDFPNVVAVVEGVVRPADDSPSERFVIDLKSALSDTRTAIGSPVVNEHGDVIGVVGPTGTNRSVDALGPEAVRRVMDELVSESDSYPSEPDALATARVTTGTLSGAGNDAVGDVDQLGFKTYVDAFAELITSPYTMPPLTIGIFGSWGMGKSFLLQNIKNEICKGSRPGPRVHVVPFNAWEYSATEVAWPGLVRKIISTLDEDVPWSRFKRYRVRVQRNLPRESKRLRVQVVAALLVLSAAIASAVLSEDSLLGGTVGAALATLGVGSALTLKAAAPVAGWITALFASSDYGRHIGYMEEIRHDLKALEGRLHEHDDPKAAVTDRILILIDDLDRCEPGKAVEVLQAVNLLLNFSSFIVCLGIDARIVTGAIEKHYDGLLGDAGASGYEYLDKIVQIPFRIPEPARDDIITFVAGQLGNPKPPDKPRREVLGPTPGGETTRPVERFPSGRPSEPESKQEPDRKPASVPVAPVAFTWDEQQAFELLVDYLRPNPRHLKRLVNVYRLVRSLADTHGERLILERPKATLRWLVMWSQWPYASFAMLERYDELLDGWKGTIPADAPAGDPMLHLLAHAEKKLDRATQTRLDDEIADLRSLLCVKDCVLDWAEIQRIRPYTVNFNPAVEEQLRRAPQPAAEPAPADTGTA